MLEIRQTDEFEDWLKRLRDRTARAKILVRIDRLALGNPGDVRPVGGGISEMRIDYGPGYRVYFTQRGAVFVILLCGGDKSSQARDIKRAKEIEAGLEV
ncbi:MAG TPA: type II toxin-antitoxin system RelE/ParE family toxin [Stellaceae bacterium]|nr:type II toxin-antitoxin system RelE/ParE family toxin [Stellaceae bacterium]